MGGFLSWFSQCSSNFVIQYSHYSIIDRYVDIFYVSVLYEDKTLYWKIDDSSLIDKSDSQKCYDNVTKLTNI